MVIRFSKDSNSFNQRMLALVLFSDMLYALANAIFLINGISTGVLYYLYYIIFGLTFVVGSICSYLKNPNKQIIRLIVPLFVLWIASEFYWIIMGQSEIYRQSITCIILTIISCIPVYIFTVNSSDFSEIIEQSKIYSVISIVYAICYVVGQRKGLYSSNDYMSFSYNLFPGCIFALYRGICQKKKISLIVAVTLMIFLVSFGSRGVLVAVVVAAFILLIKNQEKMTISSVVFWIVAFVASFFVIVNLSSIVLFLRSCFPSSRTVAIMSNDLLNGEINLANRNLYYDYFHNHLSDYIGWGTGILRDRYLISQEVSRISYGESWLGCYMHNFYFEIIMQFGFVFGGFLLVYFTYRLIKAFTQIKYMDETKKAIFLMFVPATFITYMVSGSYLHSMRFYFMLALIVLLSGKIKENSKTHSEE